MPIELTGAHPPEHRLQPGDVVIVERELKDKETKKLFMWKHFGVVILNGGRYIRYQVLDDKTDRKPVTVFTQAHPNDKLRIWYLPEDEWPDGVHVFRTKMILEGRLDEVI